jgi:S1-C subfamily serine protease
MNKKIITAIVIILCVTSGTFWKYSQTNKYTLQKLYQEKSSSVVDVLASFSKDFKNASEGTGFFISPDGLLITASHIVYKERAGLVPFVMVSLDEETFYDIVIKKVDLEHDIALLKATRKRAIGDSKVLPIFRALQLNCKDNSTAGDKVITIGNPGSFFIIMSEGIIASSRVQSSETDRDHLIYKDLIITTLVVYPGNSGGPIFNTAGEVIGVLTLGNEKEKLALFQKAKYIDRLLKDTSDKIIVYEKEPNDEKSVLR